MENSTTPPAVPPKKSNATKGCLIGCLVAAVLVVVICVLLAVGGFFAVKEAGIDMSEAWRNPEGFVTQVSNYVERTIEAERAKSGDK